MRAPGDGTGGFNFLTRSRTGRPWASFGRSVLALTPAGGVAPTPLPVSALSAAGGIDGELWIGLRNGVAHYVNGRVDTLDVRPRLDAAITALLYVSDNELWVAGDGTVSHLTAQPDGTWRRADLPTSDLPDNLPIRSLSLDGEGNLWVGTNGRGLYRAHRESTRRFGHDVGLGAVEALVSDGNGGAWAAASCAGVFHVDDDRDRRSRSSGPATPGNPVVVRMDSPPRPGATSGSARGRTLYRVRRSAPHVSRLQVTLPDEVGPIVAVPDGTFWVASRSGDVRRVNADRVLEQVTLPGPVVSISMAPDGTLWAGGAGEIFHVPGGGRPVERIGAAQGMPRGWVRDILIDR